MAAAWPIVTVVKSENRRELKLGKEVSEKIQESGLDKNVYTLININFLEISNTCLSELTDELGNLTNLTNLVLHGNLLTGLPASIGSLSRLKYLDVSHNKLEKLPRELSKLAELQTLNVLMNQLTDFPDVSTLTSLHILNISHNKLTALPTGICDENLVHLSDITANDNEIVEVPSELYNLSHLNILNLSNNKIQELPCELSDCSKLKDLKLSGNKLTDRKLARFAEQNSVKQIMQLLAAALQKATANSGKEKKVKPKKKKKGDNEVEEVAKSLMTVLKFPTAGGLIVRAEAKVADVRPYIVCCILKDVDFTQTNNMFKNFIQKQTKLHDEMCQKRQAATIATHDLDFVKGPLTYTCKPPSEIMIMPLFKNKDISAAEYYKSLQQEADALRREKKRSTVSGIHKYLDLLKNKAEFPCLLDAGSQAISLPPLTNSDKTKISRETCHVLLEVTSSESLDTCKKVMDELVKKALEMGINRKSGQAVDSQAHSEAAAAMTSAAQDEEDEVTLCAANKRLTLQQVRVEDEEGNLKVVYPSRTDLIDDSYIVCRE